MFELFRKVLGKGMKVGAEVIFALILVEVISAVTGGTNASFAIAVAIVGGGYYFFRIHKQRHPEDKFGEGLRGSEVEDHTNT